jgi:thioredoxin-like negative regulator of GroEL
MTLERSLNGFRAGIPAASVTEERATATEAVLAIGAHFSDPEVREAVTASLNAESSQESGEALASAEVRDRLIADIRSMPELTRHNLGTTIPSQGPALLTVWGPRCSACLLMAPTIEQVREALPEVAFIQADGEADRGIDAQFDVAGHPSYLLFVDGEERARFLGSRGSDVFVAEIRAALVP